MLQRNVTGLEKWEAPKASLVAAGLDAQPTSAVLTISRIEVPDSARPVASPGRRLFLAGLRLLIVAVLMCGWPDLTGERGSQLANPQKEGWKLVGGQQGVLGQEQFVLVEGASRSNPKLYDDVIRRLCRKDEWCGLHFWSSSPLIPNRLPMSDLQAASEVANYTQYPDTGFTQFVWNCQVHNDPLNCFRYQ